MIVADLRVVDPVRRFGVSIRSDSSAFGSHIGRHEHDVERVGLARIEPGRRYPFPRPGARR